MNRSWGRLGAVTTLILASATFAHAGTVHGTVINKTTGKPAASVAVVLIQLQGGMQEVAHGKSDAQGQFTFDNPGVGAQPMLVRAVYQGVNFNTPLPPGQGQAEVDVFDISKDPKLISVASHVIIFQPSGTAMLVGEEYAVVNNGQPPQAFFRADGSFEFGVPEKGQPQQVSATGSSGMPVPQATIERGNGRYAIAYAFRPGETRIRLSYELPYNGNSTSVKFPAVYPGGKLLVVAPPGMQVAGDGLQAAGQEQGMDVYTHEPLAAKALLAVNISGMPAPAASASGGADAGGQQPQEGNSRSETTNVQAIPGRLDEWKWPLLGGFAALFALAGILLTRKQVIRVETTIPAGEMPATPATQPAIAAPRAATATLAAVEAQVNTSLDALKDTLFRLELRRQAGTISEEEYAQERARAEKLLRDLVRG